MIDETIEKDNIGILENVPILYANTPGRNRNLYPEDEIINAIKYFNDMTKLDATYKYVYIRHVNDTIGESETLQLIAGWIDKIWYEPNSKTVYSNVKLLPTTWGKLVKWLVKHNYPVGTSIRGTGIPVKKVIEFNNETMEVMERRNFKLKGFDFVVEPSFITTQIAGEHYIKEQTINNTDTIIDIISKEELLNDKEKCELKQFCNLYHNEILKEKTNHNFEILEGGLNMNQELNLEHERLKLEVDKLNFTKVKLQSEIDEINSTLDKLKNELSQLEEKRKYEQLSLKNELSQLEEKRKYEQLSIEQLVSLKKELEQSISELKDQLEKYMQEKAKVEKDLEDIKKEIEMLQSKEQKLYVRKNGKVFDEENPPKIRIVEPEERTLNTEWQNVDKEFVRKISYLAYKGGNKDITQTFGLLGKNYENDYNDWKYPVCQIVKSEEDGYDFDCVLNLNGLKTAYAFMMGRPGMSLTPDERKVLAKNLLYWYKKANDAGKINEIPEQLIKLAEQSIILTGDEITDIILENLQLNGYVTVDLSDELKEQVNGLFDADSIKYNVVKAVADALIGRKYEINSNYIEVVEQVINNNFSDIDIEKEVAKFYELILQVTTFENIEELESYLEEVFEIDIISDMLLGLKPIASQVIALLVDNGVETDKAVNYVYNMFAIVSELLTKEVNDEENMNNANQDMNNDVNQNNDANNGNIMQDNNEQNDANKKLFEQDKNNSQEDLDMEKLNQIIALINDYFNITDIEITPDNVIDVLASIFNQFIEMQENLHEVSKRVDELLTEINELKKEKDVVSDVKEQTRKGKINLDSSPSIIEDELLKNLENLMKNI